VLMGSLSMVIRLVIRGFVRLPVIIPPVGMRLCVWQRVWLRLCGGGFRPVLDDGSFAVDVVGPNGPIARFVASE
jgi:hypothetical protein